MVSTHELQYDSHGGVYILYVTEDANQNFTVTKIESTIGVIYSQSDSGYSRKEIEFKALLEWLDVWVAEKLSVQTDDYSYDFRSADFIDYKKENLYYRR